MGIQSSSQLGIALNNIIANSSNQREIFDIANYLAYNYYMYSHIKKDSFDDKQNHLIYSKFTKEYPKLYNRIEEVVESIWRKTEIED